MTDSGDLSGGDAFAAELAVARVAADGSFMGAGLLCCALDETPGPVGAGLGTGSFEADDAGVFCTFVVTGTFDSWDGAVDVEAGTDFFDVAASVLCSPSLLGAGVSFFSVGTVWGEPPPPLLSTFPFPFFAIVFLQFLFTIKSFFGIHSRQEINSLSKRLLGKEILLDGLKYLLSLWKIGEVLSSPETAIAVKEAITTQSSTRPGQRKVRDFDKVIDGNILHLIS